MIHGYTENIEEKKSRNLLAKKLKEKYQRACQTVLDQFDNDHVNLAEQRLGPEHWKILAIVILGGGRSDDGCCGAGGGGDDDYYCLSRWKITESPEALAENSTLKELDLTNNRINANGMALLMAGLKYNETLEVLKDPKYNETVEVLKHNETVEVLKHYENVEVLKTLDISITRLEVLKDSDSRHKYNETLEVLKDSGIETLEVLKHNETVEVLKTLEVLKHNETVEVLKHNETVEVLKTLEVLKYNETIKVLKHNETVEVLKTLEVLKVGITSVDCRVLVGVLKVGITSVTLDISITRLEVLKDVSVDEDFMAVLERLAAKSHLNVKHGKFTRKVPVKEFRPPKPPPRDPITMIYDYKYERGYRTLDLLMQLDKDNNFIIDRQEFTDGLAVIGLVIM
ncbi:hypothetical protein DPMN_060363 [Dreissena polymorpha]|uniref:Uncharacterized protein n=1 Tax=Dreissena polymorpha TaxID=45954 RepID=A0A9D4C5R1_DREPO|nr:hypothetical protein DPMN_060363 [Dreissena polymorpha]